MSVELVYTPELAEYRLAVEHPLRPERFVLAIALADAWGLLDHGTDTDASSPRAQVVAPIPATDDELLLVHLPEYVAAVKRAGADPGAWRGAFGIGPGDTPAFSHMHEAAALACGATARALDDVVSGACQRAFSPAGGLHHAHRGYASGFCVYNDCAVAIARAVRDTPGLRVAYVDVDAHHGDGVQDAFYDRADVLTVSLHESGRYLFPGTGRTEEIGTGDGVGFALNLPLPPLADDACFALALEDLVAPALRAFAPDVVFAQLGADSHRDDPLTDLRTTVAGQYATAKRIIALADEVCEGRIAATGGGGYDTFSAVPRAWACALAALLGVEPLADVPEAWRREAEALADDPDFSAPRRTFEETSVDTDDAAAAEALDETRRTIARLTAEHPLLAG